MFKSVLNLIPLIVLIHLVNGSNILVIFSSPSRSHNVLGIRLSEGLLKQGHHVTFVNPFPSPQMENLTSIHMESISKFFEDLMLSNKELANNGVIGNFRRMSGALTTPNELFWQHPFVDKLIKEKPKFDLLITLAFFNDAILGLGQHLGVPTVVFTCIGHFTIWNNYVANPTMVYSRNPIANAPTEYFWGRLATVAANLVMGIANDYFIAPFNQGLLDKHLPHSPTLKELQRNVSLVLANSHYSVEPARPYVPNMIQVGGYHVQDVKPLPNDFGTFMDDAKHGAILFSLGGNIRVGMLDEEKRDAIFKVLAEISPIRVIFKSELEHKNVPKNVMVRNWVPQADILAHPNTKLFISHGGWGGLTESVYHGVPILGIPFVGDQIGNLNLAHSAGYAEVIQPGDISEEVFRQKLKELITNPKYSQNVKSRSSLMKDQPVKPMENVIFWIEHVIKFGSGKHLQNAGVYLTWYQLYMIDIYIFFTVVLIFLLLSIMYTIKFTMKFLTKLSGKSKVTRKSRNKSKVKKS
ncbi:UDP-glycosyltransferase UGT5-like [Coccinella septempunctata]|uniref:UDP-glycosyltransferase UGT5-like n=1 Tax=Coccinella septempunctata TaxID=41139 RepID=UPI001D09375D|nr:UDP-glycosyltransferase UGT5-like [Coccinella septempunctata]